MCDTIQTTIGTCDTGFLAEFVTYTNALHKESTSTCSYASTTSIDSITSGQFEYKNGETNFALTYTNDDTCLTVVMLCDSDLADPVGSPIYTNGTGSCATYTELSWSKSCPVYSLNSLVTLVLDYKWIFGIVAIAVGFFFTFFGLALIKVVVFLIGISFTVFAIIILFYGTFMKDNNEAWAFWLILSLSAILGCLIGFLMVKGIRFGAAILCGCGGFMLGILINEMWLYIYGSQALFWCVSIAIALICAGLAFVIFEYAVMGMTSFLGAYFMCRGLSMLVGGFPPAFELVQMVEDGAISTIDPVFYGYLAGILVLTILGFIVQFKIWKKKVEAEKHPYD